MLVGNCQAQNPQAPRWGRPSGFSLIATITILALLAVIALGFLSLSTVTVRSANQSRYDLEAKSNARLAMMMALGELQKQLGPDQRISAPASILDTNPSTEVVDGVEHPNWTGVWSTRFPDGGAVLVRDDANGGLRDRRFTEDWDRVSQSTSYLVSGNEGGREKADAFIGAARVGTGSSDKVEVENPVKLVAEGSLGDQAEDLKAGQVIARRVVVEGRANDGHFAYWVGDLGTRANVATINRHPKLEPARVSQEASSELVSASSPAGGPALTEREKSTLIMQGQFDLLKQVDPKWIQKHFHDVTVNSSGVLADVRQGGLKKDLTAYLHSSGSIRDRDGLAGLSDTDRLVGPANSARAAEEGVRWADTRHKKTAPRFGVLRSWLELAEAGGQARKFDSVIPKSEPSPVLPRLSRGANVNLNPASIASFDQASLAPILVEGSIKTNLSAHMLPATRPPKFQTRLHLYPRVVLWNPYNIELTLERSVVMMQVNGRKEYRMRLDGFGGRLEVQLVWLWAGRNSVVENPNDFWAHYENPYAGSRYYALPKTTFGPGECLVFTCPDTREINGNNLAAQELSCEVYPDPNKNFYSTNNSVSGGFDYRPISYWEEPVNGRLFGREQDFARNQADDYHMVLKALGDTTFLDHEDFDELPLITHVSCSLQYGAGKEPRVQWSRRNPVPMEYLDYQQPVVNSPPDVRTRDGFRMRWFLEHPSNQLGSGEMKGSLEYLDEAHLANWNPRAAYIARSPWGNIGGDLPVDNFPGGGPWFFGIYTRDLFDEEVGWASQLPVWKDGRARGNPFGPPQDPETYKDRYILFDVPQVEDGIQSLAHFQHTKLSEFGWHPSFIVGQSLVDPRVGRTGTHPPLDSPAAKQYGGWDPASIGWSSDTQRSSGRDEWAEFGRAFFQNYPETEMLVYDISYETNHSLWDSFFLSTGRPELMDDFLKDAQASPLPSGRHVLAPATRSAASKERLRDFHQAAYHLMVDGMFNVNSTSVEAWKAMLGSTRLASSGDARTPFARFAVAQGGEWQDGNADDDETWSGTRVLSDEDLQRLAEEMVYQVKTRGPFLSLADFVNRRLVDDDTGLMGPLQAAIEASGLNVAFEQSVPYNVDNSSKLADYAHPDNIQDATRLEQTLKPSSKLWGTPGYLTQGDVLQSIGPTISVRSDTYIIRAYGDAVDDHGTIRARSWCEVIVQRTPEPVHPDKSGLNSERRGEKNDFGRRFTIQSFRWLSPGEV